MWLGIISFQKYNKNRKKSTYESNYIRFMKGIVFCKLLSCWELCYEALKRDTYYIFSELLKYLISFNHLHQGSLLHFLGSNLLFCTSMKSTVPNMITQSQLRLLQHRKTSNLQSIDELRISLSPQAG